MGRLKINLTRGEAEALEGPTACPVLGQLPGPCPSSWVDESPRPGIIYRRVKKVSLALKPSNFLNRNIVILLHVTLFMYLSHSFYLKN